MAATPDSRTTTCGGGAGSGGFCGAQLCACCVRAGLLFHRGQPQQHRAGRYAAVDVGQHLGHPAGRLRREIGLAHGLDHAVPPARRRATIGLHNDRLQVR